MRDGFKAFDQLLTCLLLSPVISWGQRARHAIPVHCPEPPTGRASLRPGDLPFCPI